MEPDEQQQQQPTPKPARAMPRESIQAITVSGYFCGLMTCFLAYYAWRMQYPFVFTVINTVTALFMFAGSTWMWRQLVIRK